MGSKATLKVLHKEYGPNVCVHLCERVHLYVVKYKHNDSSSAATCVRREDQCVCLVVR